MPRAVVVVALALALAAPGCLQGGVEGLWSDLEAKPAFEERSLFREQVEFSASGTLDPENPPQDEDDTGDRWNTTVEVPEGTKSLTVVFTVNFSDPAGENLPMDPSSSDGQIRIYAEGPDAGNESQSVTYEKSAEGGFDFNGPTPGGWTLGYEAVGQGTVDFRMFGKVPVEG